LGGSQSTTERSLIRFEGVLNYCFKV
jgi:hypothetical protein